MNKGTAAPARRLLLAALWPLMLAVRGALGQSANDGFDPNVNGPVLTIVAQSDGKIIIGGEFTRVSGVTRSNLARLNVDGSVDDTFDPGASGSHPFVAPAVYALALQADGRILVGGFFTTLGGLSRSNLARLNRNGTVDATFDPGADNFVLSLAVQEDGRTVVGGYFRSLGGQPRNRLGRLNADGTLDGSFAAETDDDASSTVDALLLHRDGKLLVAGQFNALSGQPRAYLGRLHADGRLDSQFNPEVDGPVRSLARQVDGKIVVGGFFTTLGGKERRFLGRLNVDGTADGLDARINPDNAGFVDSLAVQADGKILIGGVFAAVGGEPRHFLTRLQVDGSLDVGFKSEADSTVTCLTVQSDGKILVGGHFTALGSGQRNHIGRLYADGSLDTTLNTWVNFNPPGGGIYCLAVQPDGNILVGGMFDSLGTTGRLYLGRLFADGAVDMTFSPFASWLVYSVAVQMDGKILTGGSFTALGGQHHEHVARINADGTMDGSFNPAANLRVNALAVQADGKILTGGYFTNLNGQTRRYLGRLNADGTLDDSFDPGANTNVLALAVQADGKILVGGLFTEIAGQPRQYLGRLNADGTLDGAFHAEADGAVLTLVPQADGKILAGGTFTMLAGQPRSRLGRLNRDGTLDASFLPAADGYVISMALQADGSVVLGGAFSSLGGQARSRLGRVRSDGAVDEFSPTVSPLLAQVLALAQQPDGKTLVAGDFPILNGESRRWIGRLTSGTAARQMLAINASGTAATWSRGGSAPEVEQVCFEQTDDGTTFTQLGPASRVNGGWQLTGLALPLGRNFYLRARGRATCGIFNGSSSVIESVAQFWPLPPPFISSVQVLGGGAFQFSFTNTNAVCFRVLASTNVAAPLVSWENLGVPVSVGGGVYQFTDAAATNHARRFYQLQTP